MGSNSATIAISSALDLPFADAEDMKRRLGTSEAQVRSAERAVQPTIGELVGEIRNSIQYFASLPGRAPIVGVTITGAGARLRGLVEQLQGQIHIPVQFVSPLSRLDLSGFDLSPEQIASIEPVLAAPIGLALPEPNPDVKKFNLVPPEVLRRDRDRQLIRYSAIGAALVVVILGGLSVWRFLQVHNAQNDVSTLRTSVAALQAQIPTYDKVVSIAKELRVAQTEVTHISSTTVDWSAVVGQLGQRIPSGLSIITFTGTGAGTSGTAASTTSAAATLAGTAPAGSIGSLQVGVSGTFPNSAHFDPVAEWIDGLSSSPMFSPPGVASVTNTAVGGNTAVSFQSNLWLTPQANLAKNVGS